MKTGKSSSESVHLWDFFEVRSRAFAKLPAVVDGQTSLTFSEVISVADGLARNLTRAGFSPGNTVALSLPGSPAFVPAFLGLCRVSARIALFPPKYGAREIQNLVEGLQVQFLLTTTSLAPEIMRKTTVPSELVEMETGRAGISLAAIRCRAVDAGLAGKWGEAESRILDAASVIKTTSGSTGLPKSVALSARAVEFEAMNVAESLNVAPGARILCPVQPTHSYGFDLGVLASLYSGATLHLVESFIPRNVLSLLSQKGTEVFLGVPSMYQILADLPVAVVPSISNLRLALSCTAPLSVSLIEKFHTRFGVPLCQHYGSSETGAVSTHVPSEVLARPTSVGLPLRNVFIRVTDGARNFVEEGTEGEIEVQSEGLALGYVSGRPVQRNPFVDGWFRTGDRGRIDRDGFIHLEGRIDDVINVGGFKVFPIEVLRVLEGCPSVREAAVVAIPDPAAGEVVCAAVALRSPASEADLIDHCRERLADYKVPRRIEIRDQLPRGASGKILFRPEDLRVS
jgi:long-chain acyl-CoA synthetase